MIRETICKIDLGEKQVGVYSLSLKIKESCKIRTLELLCLISLALVMGWFCGVPFEEVAERRVYLTWVSLHYLLKCV